MQGWRGDSDSDVISVKQSPLELELALVRHRVQFAFSGEREALTAYLMATYGREPARPLHISVRAIGHPGLARFVRQRLADLEFSQPVNLVKPAQRRPHRPKLSRQWLFWGPYRVSLHTSALVLDRAAARCLADLVYDLLLVWQLETDIRPYG